MHCLRETKKMKKKKKKKIISVAEKRAAMFEFGFEPFRGGNMKRYGRCIVVPLRFLSDDAVRGTFPGTTARIMSLDEAWRLFGSLSSRSHGAVYSPE